MKELHLLLYSAIYFWIADAYYRPPPILHNTTTSNIADAYSNWALPKPPLQVTRGSYDSFNNGQYPHLKISPTAPVFPTPQFHQENMHKVKHYIHPIKKAPNAPVMRSERLYPQRIETLRLPETLMSSNHLRSPQQSSQPVQRVPLGGYQHPTTTFYSTPYTFHTTTPQPTEPILPVPNVPQILPHLQTNQPVYGNSPQTSFSSLFNFSATTMSPSGGFYKPIPEQNRNHPLKKTVEALERRKVYANFLKNRDMNRVEVDRESMENEENGDEVEEEREIEREMQRQLRKKKFKYGRGHYRKATFYPYDSDCEFGFCGRICCVPQRPIHPPTIHAMALPGSPSPPSPMVLVVHPQCSPQCQPMCLPNCGMVQNRQAYSQHMCRPDCMPGCHVDCLILPPETVQCSAMPCRCSSGYMMCAPMTCCLIYRNMVKKFRADVEDDLKKKNRVHLQRDGRKSFQITKDEGDYVRTTTPTTINLLESSEEVVKDTTTSSKPSTTSTTTTTTAATTTTTPTAPTTTTETTTVTTTTITTTPSTTTQTTTVPSTTHETLRPIVFRKEKESVSQEVFRKEMIVSTTTEAPVQQTEQLAGNHYTVRPHGINGPPQDPAAPRVLVPVYSTIPTYQQWELGKKKKKDLETQFVTSRTFMNILQELAGFNPKFEHEKNGRSGEIDELGYFEMLVNNNFERSEMKK